MKEAYSYCFYDLPSYQHVKKPPVIGITVDMVDARVDPGGSWYSVYPWYAIGRRYSDAVVLSGGVPLMLCYNLSNVETYSRVLDGLLVAGVSADIDPVFYGENVHKTTNSRPKKTQFEWAISKRMIDMNKPVLGINTGMQIINVVQGGTLCQNFAEERRDAYNHQQQAPLIFPHHEVIINKATKLCGYIGDFASNRATPLREDSTSIVIETNSYHRQVIKTLGERLKESAVSPDNVIESIESTELDFCVGVQWNAEFFVTAADRAIFSAFIAASSSNNCSRGAA